MPLFLKQIAVISMCLVALGCQTSDTAHPKKTVHLTVLHTNDHHGRFWHNKHGEYGLAARKTLVDRIRAEVAAEGGYTLLLSGGDINTGVPESDALDAEPDFKGMSLVGYDAMAVGNHEFDNSLSVIRQQEEWSNFPFLSANIFNAQNERVFEPYRIFSFGDANQPTFNVAVLGLTTHKTAEIGNPVHIKGLKFTLPETETLGLMPELEAQSDMVIAVTHMGHSAYTEGSDVTLAQAVEGLDLIVGGHSAEPVCIDAQKQLRTDFKPGMACKPDFHNGTWVVQAHEWGKYVGRADFEITRGKVKLKSYELIPVNMTLKDESGVRQPVGEKIAADEEVMALLQPFQEKGSEALKDVIGETSGTFWRNDGDRWVYPSPLGRFITQAFLEGTRADIAITNDGGIRDSLPTGEITLKNLLQVMPFGNTLVAKPFTGKELVAYFETIELLPTNVGEIHYSGMTILDTVNAERLSRQYPHGTIDPRILIGGQPLRMDKTYRLTTTNYLGGGGNGYPKLIGLPGFEETGIPDVEVVKALFKRVKVADPKVFEAQPVIIN